MRALGLLAAFIGLVGVAGGCKRAPSPSEQPAADVKLFEMAWNAFDYGDYKKAQEAFGKLVARFPGTPEAAKASVILQLCKAHKAVNDCDWQRAQEYEKAARDRLKDVRAGADQKSDLYWWTEDFKDYIEGFKPYRIAARIQWHRRKGDTAALAKEAASADVWVARLAIDALGDSGPRGVPHIERAMRDDRPQVREKAAAALGRAAKRDRSALLAEAVRTDPVASVRAAAAAALGRMRAYNEVETLIEALDDKDTAVRRRANEAISRITGVHSNFRADDPVEDREKAIAMIRELWPGMKPNVERYYTRGRGKDPKR